MKFIITIDTEKDFEKIKTLISELPDEKKDLILEDLYFNKQKNYKNSSERNEELNFMRCGYNNFLED